MKIKMELLAEKAYSPKNNQPQKKCGYSSVLDCPYTSEKDCKFDKTNCLLIEDKQSKKKNDYTNLRISFFMCIGLLIYIIVAIFSNDKTFEFKYCDVIYKVVSGVSISVIAGAILAKVIDIPSKLKDYETSFINALASNSYLKSLDEKRLEKLRNDITEQLHKANAPCMAKGLINIDQRVCELLRQPYYSRYRHSIICTLKNKNDKYMIKEHSIDYKLINPYSVNKEATEYVTLSNLILSNKERGTLEDGEIVPQQENANSTIMEMKIICKKDDGDSIEYKEDKDFELKYDFNINSKTEYYDTEIYLEAKNKSESDKKRGIRIDFKDNIEIHMEYKLKVSVEDKCFTKRMRHPVKNLRLDYSCNNFDGELFGQIFGTELKQSDFSIKYPTKNSVSIEAFDWLLPDNGAIIMLNNIK